MADYILPNVLVHQEFQAVPTRVTNNMRAFIFGPNYNLHRYAVSSEKTSTYLGELDPTMAVSYSWPGREAGEVVDFDYTKLNVEDAWGRFYQQIGSVNRVAGYYNKIRWSSKNVKANGATYPLDASFYGRDCKVGDGVYIEAPGGEKLWTYITGFEYDTVAATIEDPASTDSNNMVTTTAAVGAVTGTADPVLNIANPANWEGYRTGYKNGSKQPYETYTLTCTAVNGATLADCVFALSSTYSGDSDTNVTFTDFGSGNSEIAGNYNLELYFTSGSSTVPTLGDTWTFSITGEYEAPVGQMSGTYTGIWNTTYILKCLVGGDAGGSVKPQFVITTNTGVDTAGPVTYDGTAMSVGNYGLLVQFDDGSATPVDKIAPGDIFYIDVTAAGNGPIRTMVLANNIASTVLTSDSLNVDLFIRKDLELTEVRYGHPTETNFDQSATQITVNTGMLTTDSTWQSGTVELPVLRGSLYTTYRGLLQTYANDVSALYDVAEVEDTLGAISQDNPLAYGVYNALLNSGGVEVKFMAVPTNDLSGYSDVIDAISDREDVYSLVPLTQDVTIQTMVAAHILSSSTPEIGRWRIGWFAAEPPVEVARVELNDSGTTAMCEIAEDPSNPGNYTYVTVADMDLLEKEIVAGDEFRFDYTIDITGEEVYTVYEVDQVLSTDTLRLVTGPASPTAIPQKFEIWHEQTKQQKAEWEAARAQVFGNRRIRLVYAVDAKLGGISIDNIYVACMMAGLRSSVLPQQGLTNVEFLGLDYVNSAYYSTTQLNFMAGNGVWLISQEPLTAAATAGRIYIRHQLTTSTTDINTQEDTITCIVDQTSFVFRDSFRPYIGRVNITPDMLNRIHTICRTTIDYLKTVGIDLTVGPMLIDGVIVEVRQHAVLQDRVVVRIELTVPYPLNGLELFLVV